MTEKQLHKSICNYIKLQYPKVLFNTDLSGLKMTIGQAKQAKQLRSCSGFPDIVIYRSVAHPVFYRALFLEVKKESPFNKSGNYKTEHIKKQAELHEKLEHEGYKIYFVWSFEQAKSIIDRYLK